MKEITLEERLIVIETLLGLRELDKPELERLRFEQAAYAGKLLNLAANSFSFAAFQDDLLDSYVREQLARLRVTKQISEPCDCAQCQEKSA